jgi:hypothetical protein
VFVIAQVRNHLIVTNRAVEKQVGCFVGRHHFPVKAKLPISATLTMLRTRPCPAGICIGGIDWQNNLFGEASVIFVGVHRKCLSS